MNTRDTLNFNENGILQIGGVSVKELVSLYGTPLYAFDKAYIEKICKNEKIKITDEAIDEIAYLSEGGMRDALSILDQLASDNNEITLPGLGVFFEILWNNSENDLKDKILSILKNNFQQKKD